jgi:hypothetical protein
VESRASCASCHCHAMFLGRVHGDRLLSIPVAAGSHDAGERAVSGRAPHSSGRYRPISMTRTAAANAKQASRGGAAHLESFSTTRPRTTGRQILFTFLLQLDDRQILTERGVRINPKEKPAGAACVPVRSAAAS